MRIKGRLKNIEPIGFDLNDSVRLMLEDYYSLIEQAERVQELERKIERYREALEFYADKENHEPNHYDPDTHEYMSVIDYDEGATSRKALEESE